MQYHAAVAFEMKHIEAFHKYLINTASIDGDRSLRDIVLVNSGFRTQTPTPTPKANSAKGRKSPTRLKSLRQINADKLKELGQTWRTQHLTDDNKQTRNSLVLEAVILKRTSQYRLPYLEI